MQILREMGEFLELKVNTNATQYPWTKIHVLQKVKLINTGRELCSTWNHKSWPKRENGKEPRNVEYILSLQKQDVVGLPQTYTQLNRREQMHYCFISLIHLR